MLNRREFVSLLAAASLSVSERWSPAAEGSAVHDAIQNEDDSGFPRGDYTPFGYLDNPWHTWNMHPSGVLRSLPGIGFGLYYPAGPGGYFDYLRNGVYAAELAVALRIGERTWMESSDYQPGQLSANHHTKNVLTYRFREEDVEVECAFFQVDEDAMASELRLINEGGESRKVDVLALHTHQLGWKPVVGWRRDRRRLRWRPRMLVDSVLRRRDGIRRYQRPAQPATLFFSSSRGSPDMACGRARIRETR